MLRRNNEIDTNSARKDLKNVTRNLFPLNGQVNPVKLVSYCNTVIREIKAYNLCIHLFSTITSKVILDPEA